MAVDYFLLEGARAVPVEFSAWQDAHLCWVLLADRVLRCESWSGSEFEALDAQAIEAKSVADDLERKARAAFSSWGRS